jgi:hypothetical protein
MILFALSFLLSSCFEEEANPGFLNNTVWEINSSGAVHEGDKFLYSFLETHTLTFSKSAFTYSINRKETEGASSLYQEKKNEQTQGTYAVKYPEITLTSETYVRMGVLSANVLIMYTNDVDQPLFFTRKKQNEVLP